MKLIVKMIIESLFDDDMISNHDEVISNVISNNIRARSLSLCLSEEDIVDYLYDKFFSKDENVHIRLVKQYIDRIQKRYSDELRFMKAPDLSYLNARLIGTILGIGNRYNGYYIQLSNEIKLYIGIREDKIIYRKKEVFVPCVYLTVNKIEGPYSNLLSNKYITVHLLTNEKAASYKTLQLYNAELIKNLEDIVTKLVKTDIYKFYNVSRLYEEITATGKVYPVVQKDIDRMKKCFATYNFSGFDKITKPEKMVARIAASLICANKSANKSSIGDISMTNDDLLLYTFSQYTITKYDHSNSQTIFEILRHIQQFPQIHLTDVIMTYNEYKDKF